MNIGKLVRSSVLVSGVLAANVAMFAGSALAGDRGRNYGHDRGRSYHYAQPYAHGYHGNHYKKKRNNNGAAIAIGLGALILGTMIASEANRHHRSERYDRYDD